MKKFALMIAVAGLMMACGSEEGNTDNGTTSDDTTATTSNEDPTPEPAMLAYGEEITADGAMNPAAFMAALGDQQEMTGKMVTTINSCCQKKGCWMSVDLGNGEEMRVTFKDYGFFAPLNSGGSDVVMEGRVYYDTISVDMARHYAMDGGMSEDEAIATITEPEASLSFEATGILVDMEGVEPELYMADNGDNTTAVETTEGEEGHDHEDGHDH